MKPHGLHPQHHPDWLVPHSLPWYTQLSKLQQTYTYPWRSSLPEPNAESIFTEEVAQLVTGKTVLDIGCGHGAYALQWSSRAKRFVGLDVTDLFIEIARGAQPENVSFVVGNTKERLPFEDDSFDFAYNRKGPISAYADCKRILRKGGLILGLHPSAGFPKELSEYLPLLFEKSPVGKAVLPYLTQQLQQANFTRCQIEEVISTEYLPTPLDAIKLRCFGQTPAIYRWVLEQHLDMVIQMFHEHATTDGLPLTHACYLVRPSPDSCSA